MNKKFSLVMLALCVGASFNFVVAEDSISESDTRGKKGCDNSNIINKKLTKIIDKLNKCCACEGSIGLRQKDFSPITGLVINKPGCYCLEEDITFDPVANNVPAITINADFVRIDLNCHTLKQSVGTFDNTTAILINSGFNNIVIHNGTITDFTNFGIRALSADATSFRDHVGVFIHDLRIKNIGKTTSSGAVINAAIRVDGTTDFFVDKCYISDLFTNNEVGSAREGISSVRVNHMSVTNSTISNFLGESRTPRGIRIIGFDNVEVDNCVVSDFETSTDLEGIRIQGDFIASITSTFGNNMKVTNVQISNLVANGGTCNGMILSTPTAARESRNGLVENCQISKLKSNSLVQGLAAGTRELRFINCILSDFEAPQIIGYFADTVDSNFTNCTAANFISTTTTAGIVAGFFITQFSTALIGEAKNRVLNNCYSGHHRGEGDKIVAGYSLAGVRDINTNRNPMKNCILDSCVASDILNTTTAINGVGILLGSMVSTNTAQNLVTNCNFIDCVCLANGVGFRVDRGMNNVIKNCEFKGNLEFGVLDDSDNCNVYVSNVAFNSGTNYAVGLSLTNPIRFWNRGAGLPGPVVSGDIDNLDIICTTTA